MSISIDQFRAAIGTFYIISRNAIFRLKRKFSHCITKPKPHKFTFFLYFNLIIHILLIISGVSPNPGPSYSNYKPFSFCHLNARSILSHSQKIDEIRSILAHECDYDVIAITETWLNNNTLANEEDLFIQNYHTILRKDRSNNMRGGGVAVYVRDSVRITRLFDIEPVDLELMWLQLKVNFKTIIFGVCYRQPNATRDEATNFITNLSTSLEQALYLNPDCLVLLGDFNDTCTIWDSPHTNSELGNGLVNLLASLDLFQIVTESTRKDHILDLIITDSPGFITKSGVDPPLANLDHCTIYGHLDFKHHSKASFSRTVFDYKNIDFDKMNDSFLFKPWDIIFQNSTDINEIISNWYAIFWSTFDAYVQKKVIKIRNNDKPWMTLGIKKLIKLRNRLYHKWKSSKIERDHTSFRFKRSEVSAAINQAKINHSLNMKEKLSKASKSPKLYWSVLKSLYGQKVNSGIPSLVENEELVTDTVSIANILNNHFANQSILPTDHHDFDLTDNAIIHRTQVKLNIVQFEEYEVHKVLTSLNISKASGPDKVSNLILKRCALGLSPSLCGLFNHSLLIGKFPVKWKEAHVTPIFKKDDKLSKLNYRPISLLSCISKVFERLVFDILFKHCVTHKLLTPKNSGFKPCDSAVNQLVSLVNKIYGGLDDRNEIAIIFLDISKAFDRVWHAGLLFKLKSYGITGKLLQWLQSYLTGRKQCVVIEGVSSQWRDIQAGVPQGSILGPLLFLFFINDIVDSIESDINLFADDTSLLETVSDPIVSANKLQRDLVRIEEWALKWKVTFNATKTKLLIISLKNDKFQYPDLKLNGTNIRTVECHTHLGLTLNSRMTWHDHVENICQKASKRLALLKRVSIRYNLNRKDLETIYFSMIRSIIEYCDIIYNNCTIEQAKSLESIQHQAALVCSRAYKRTHYLAILDELGWDLLETRRQLHRLSLFHKIYYGIAPEYLHILIQPFRLRPTRYPTRHDEAYLQPPFSRLTMTADSFFPSTIRLWNQLDSSIKLTKYHPSFKFKLKKTRCKAKNLLFYTDGSKQSVNHARIRMGLSALNHQRYSYDFITQFECSCGNLREDASHFLLNCPNFTAQRQGLLRDAGDLITEVILRLDQPVDIQRTVNSKFLVDLFLYGHCKLSLEENTHLFKHVQTYIKETNRFL